MPNSNFESFEARKRAHIQLALDPAHQAAALSGLDRVRLVHEALPDLDFSEVKLGARCLGQELATPFYVAGMTAGHADAPALNLRLALACEARGWAMGVGSQRRELDAPSAEWKDLRKQTPKLTVFANLGISQLIGCETFARVRALVDGLGARALVVHLNALQEALQPEGTPQFRGAFKALERCVRELGVPVAVKETGCGFSRETLARLRGIGLAAVDVSGLGGTHWGRIEGSRAAEAHGALSVRAQAAMSFADWGVATVDSVIAARAVLSAGTEVWASGGVRSGLDAAKLIALGADRVGYAQPALRAALAGEMALNEWMELQEFELRTALFCTGSLDCEKLKQRGKAECAAMQ